MSERIRKSFAIILVVALTLTMLGLAGCNGGGDEGEGEEEPTSDVTKGGTFNFYISEPAFIDPVNLQESEGTQVGQAVFDSLVAFD
ncbi:ABC transporter substrate-binding protein, partial [bacterium]|nr:ABC transporter substrate-binding protein [bacterium]